MYEQYHACNSCVNRRVSIQTVSGAFHEGVIVKVDHQNVYLDTSSTEAVEVSSKKTKGKAKANIKANAKAKTSALGFGLGGSQAILTLALFDLLAIALLV